MTIGYSGYVYQAETLHQYSTAELVQYETPVYDVGNAFSGGEFTCPVTGLYFISCAIKALDNVDGGNYIRATLYKTSLKFRILFSKKFDNANFNMGLVQCNQGEIFKVKLSGGDLILYGGEAVTTLTVFLVQETGNESYKSYFSNDIIFILVTFPETEY